MITPSQEKYIHDLYVQLGQEPENDIETLTKEEASELIQELLAIKEELK